MKPDDKDNRKYDRGGVGSFVVKYYGSHGSALKLLALIALSVFVCEAVVMLLVPFFPDISVWVNALLDATILVALLSPIFYLFIFRPLLVHIKSVKRSGEELEKSYTILEGVFEGTTDAVYVKDLEGRYLMMNTAGARFTGKAVEEIIGLDDDALFPYADARKIMEGDRRIMASGESGTVEERATSGGVTKTYLSIKAPFRNARGEVIGLIGISRDITARKLLEMEREFRNTVLTTQLETSLDAILVVNDVGQVLSYNRHFVEMWSVPKDVVESRSYEKALLAMLKKVEDPEGFLHGVKYLDEHSREKSSDEVPLSDGRTLDRYSAPMTGADGKYIGRVWYFRDITDRKRTEELVSERTHDMGKRIKELDCLYGASRLMSDPGVTTAGLFEGILKLIPPSWQYPEITCASITYLGRQYKTERFKTSRWRQGADITVSGELKGSVEVYYLEERKKAHEGPFMKEERDLIDALARELGRFAERREADEDKERMLEELLQSQKMEAVGRLAGGIAHDFNNMMVVVKVQSALGMDKVKRGGPGYACFEKIQSASDRAVELTRKLSAFSRNQPTEFSECSLNDVVAKLLELLPPLIGEDVTISTELEPALWTTMADRPNLTQVILNLAINARDAMEGGGSITIKTENTTIEKRHAMRHVEERPGRFVLLTVTDTGCGMDKETVEHIFEPFYTTKEYGKGTGLGLSVAYGILKSHNGWIEVESSRDKGSVFKVYLPVTEEVKGRAVKSKPASTKELAGRGERILLVEDEDLVRTTTKLVLVESGYVVVDAEDSTAAVGEFEEAKGDFQLVVSDVVLPDKSGIELVVDLISRKPGLKVILMSGYLDDEQKMSKIREMGLKFIEKPYEVPELLQAVREAVGKRGD